MQGPQQDGVDDAEDRGVDADPQGEREHDDGDEAGLLAHAADGVLQVLAQLREVLARADREEAGERPHPDAGARDRAGGVAVLLAEHLLQLAAVVGAEVEREEPKQAAEQACLNHVSRALGMRLLARAMPSAVSIRRASA